MWAVLRTPAAIREFGILGGLCSAAVVVVTTAGAAGVLSNDGGRTLPVVYVLLAVVGVPLASVLSAALGRWPAIAVCRVASLLAMGVCVLLQVAMAARWAGGAEATCIIGYVIEIIFDTLFWLVATEHLATRDLKRHTPALAISFGIGGVVAGVLASVFCRLLTVNHLMLLAVVPLALAYCQCGRISRRLQRLEVAGAADDEPGYLDALCSAWSVFRAFPISVLIALSILLMSALFCLQDYLAMTIFSMSLSGQDELGKFLAGVSAGQQGLEILILLVCGKFLDNVRPFARNLLFPLTTLACLLPLLWTCILPVAVLLSLNANSVSNGIFEPVKTINYAVVPHAVLPPLRMLLEGSIYPLGIALAGGALLVLQASVELRGIAAVSVVLSLMFLAASGVVGILFVPSMIRGLRVRRLHPSRYELCSGTRLFSRDVARRLLRDSDAAVREFGQALAQDRYPELLHGDGAGRRRNAAHVRLHRCCRSVRSLLRRQSTCSRRDRKEMRSLVSRLRHSDPRIRRLARRQLAKSRNRALSVLRQDLGGSDFRAVQAAVRSLAAMRSRRARRILRLHLDLLYDRARRNLAAIQVLEVMAQESERTAAAKAASSAFEDANRAILRRVLGIQAALGRRRDVALLQGLAEGGEAVERSDAIEALTNMPTGSLIRPLLPILEPHARDRTTKGVSCPLSGEPDNDSILWAAAADDPVLRRLITPLLTKLKPLPCRPEEDEMLEIVLFLKTVPLFRELPPESLVRAAATAESVRLNAGDRVSFPGEPDARIYVVRSGCVDLLVGNCVVDRRECTGLLGLSALTHVEQHNVSARCTCACELLGFPSWVLRDLLAEEPGLLWAVVRDAAQAQQQSYLQLAHAHRRESTAATGSGTRPVARILRLVETTERAPDETMAENISGQTAC